MEVTNKKIGELRRNRESWIRLGADAEDGVKWWYENQVKILDYDIEDAVKAEAKRRTRLALKHIEKKLAEVKELRDQVETFLDDEFLGWTERMNFETELEKVFDLRRLRFGDK